MPHFAAIANIAYDEMYKQMCLVIVIMCVVVMVKTSNISKIQKIN